MPSEPMDQPGPLTHENTATVRPEVQPRQSPKRSKMSLVLVVAAVLLLVAAAVFAGHMWSKSSTKTTATTHRVVKLGLIAPLTGDDANYGQVMQQGVELAQNDFNDPNLTFQILVRDTQCDPTQAAAETAELVKAGVTAIIGDTCSGSTKAAIPVAAAHHVLIVSPSASSPALTNISKYFWRDYPTDSHQGVFVAKMMYQKGIRKLAIMHSTETYGTGLDGVVVASFKALGGTVVADDTFQTTDVNFQTQLQAIQADKPDAFYVSTNGEAAGAAIVVEAKQLGLNAPIYGGDALKDASFLTDVGSAGNGMTLLAPTPGDTAFLDEYKATYGSAPANATGAQAYDAFMALANIIKKGATTSDQIIQSLPSVNFQGVSGQIKFDKNHDLAGGGYLVYNIKDGQFEELTNQ